MLSEAKVREVLRRHGERNPPAERVQSLRRIATVLGDAVLEQWREERRTELRRALCSSAP